MRAIFLLTVFLFLVLISIFRLFSSRSSRPSNPSFVPAFVRLNQPQNPADQIIKKLYPEPQASLLSGILIGTKAQMPGSLYSALQKTGTLHMIALSGQNISLVISLIAFLLQGLGKRLSSLITIIIIIIFILFVGPSASAIRSGLMGGFVMVSIIFGRQYLAVLGLVISGLLMFVISPEVLFDIGFQLSFAATLGILLLGSSRWVTRARGWRAAGPIWTDLQITLAAQIFTLPIILYNFGNLSIVAPLSNVLILWTIPILMYGGFAVVLLFLFFNFMNFITISHVASWLLLPFLNWFVLAVNWTSGLPFASFTIKSFPLWLAFFYYGVLFFFLGFSRLKK